ncbi:MAG TPA: cellulase family glycosylhydrolase, partial [Thermoanaerobaculia bacterium]|nr:cellulase family glycosylhydrolase [Thermoanaerobaculia bacterium]
LAVARRAAADDLSPYGVNVHAPGGAQLVAQLDRVERAGIGWVRIDFIWAAIQPQRGVYDWAHYDALVAAAQQRGLSILAIIAYTPAWATDGDEISGVPRDVEDWKAFCTKAATRYRGKIAAWELWNEPNLQKFWAGSRQQYWQQILIPGADVIHAADPQALVAGPALAHLQSRDWHHWLLETLQTAGDRIDVVTHHLYDGDGASDVTTKLDGSTQFGSKPGFWNVVAPSVREVLKAADARDKPFWLTETGWQSGDVGEARQADEYRRLLSDWLTASGARTWVSKVFFYELQDGPDFSWGVLRADGSTKPAYAAYRDFTVDHPAAPPLLLHDGRFRVQATWRTGDGRRGAGQPLSFSRESGRFWFFNPGNTELVVKVLDGAAVNGQIWVFWGALSDVEYWLTVTDTTTGAIRRYHNAPGTLCGGADTRAFASPPPPALVAGGASAIASASWLVAAPESPAPQSPIVGDAPSFAAAAMAASPFSPASPPMSVAAPAATCAGGAQSLCLGGNRFRVEGSWRLPSGIAGPASAVAADADSGSFWFFSPDNLELAVKVLDGRGVNGRFWVFFGALSDVEYWVTVTDVASGAARTYHNVSGTLCGQADTAAF